MCSGMDFRGGVPKEKSNPQRDLCLHGELLILERKTGKRKLEMEILGSARM